MKIFIAIVLICFVVSACSSQSSSRDASEGGYGYKETRISEQRYRVTFKARGDNSNTAMNYALLRAAELSLGKGYDWFEVVDRQTEIIHSMGDEGSKVQVRLEIWMDKGVRPDSRNAYSAREVENSLRQNLELNS